MEKESRFGTKSHLLRLFGIALLIFVAMLLCALAGYRFVRMSGIAENPVKDAQSKKEATPSPQQNVQTGNNQVAPTSLPEEDVQIPDTANSYLIISENDTVKLYTIKKGDRQTFKQVLPIALDALLTEDRILLENGIVLHSETELAALLEDYTS